MVNKSVKFKDLGDRALDKGEYQDALRYFDRWVYLDQNNSNAWTRKAAAEIYLQKYDDAIKSADEAIKLDRKNADAWFNKGLIFDKRRKYDDALKYYEHALRNNPRHVKTLNNKGTVLGQMERWDDAKHCFEQVLKIEPNNEDAKENIKLLDDYRAGKHKRRCFIATAAYGTPFAQELNILRMWRDTNLVRTRHGNEFVMIYYRISPKIVVIISRFESLKAITRMILKPLILFLTKKSDL